jgi:hypothetical protein
MLLSIRWQKLRQYIRYMILLSHVTPSTQLTSRGLDWRVRITNVDTLMLYAHYCGQVDVVIDAMASLTLFDESLKHAGNCVDCIVC